MAPAGDTWQSGNLLRRCPDPALVVQGLGQQLHGRDFHLLEPHGAVLLINVELKVGDGPGVGMDGLGEVGIRCGWPIFSEGGVN